MNKFDSNIVETQNSQSELLQLCFHSTVRKLSLLYRATRDGFSADSFHLRCDGKAKTLTIVKSEHGNIFGGFTTKAWTSKDEWKSDPDAFIFSFINKENNPFKVPVFYGIRAILSGSNYGPTFGGGNDIYINSGSDTNRESYSDFGHTYKHPDYAYQTERAQSILAGSYEYKTLEIEVFNLL